MRETIWLRLADAARVAGLPRSTFDDLVRRGEIPFAPTPLGRLFDRIDVEEWVLRQREATRVRAA